jgi:SHS family lactate transporter-like MFS transporter
MINAGAAAVYLEDFGLRESELAGAFAWASLGSIVGLVLGRMMDRLGRRRMLLTNTVLLGIGAIATALAPSLLLFILAQILVGGSVAGLSSNVGVFITEELPDEARARGQAARGLIGQLGSGAGLIGVAAFVVLAGSWRWVWMIVALPLLALPLLRRVVHESGRYETAKRAGEIDRSRPMELVGPVYRRRFLGAAAAVILLQMATSATMSWLLLHAETRMGLSPAWATAIVIGGGALGLVGFPVGAYFADTIGRRWTVFIFGSIYLVGNTAYYWVPSSIPPVLGLASVFGVASIGFGAATVASGTGIQEMFPTRLRGTLAGAFGIASAAGVMLAHTSVSVLTDVLGGLVPAITLVACLGLPGPLIFLLVLPETRGLSLEEASLEEV